MVSKHNASNRCLEELLTNMSITNNSGNYLDREGFLKNFIGGQVFYCAGWNEWHMGVNEVCSNRKKTSGCNGIDL